MHDKTISRNNPTRVRSREWCLVAIWVFCLISRSIAGDLTVDKLTVQDNALIYGALNVLPNTVPTNDLRLKLDFNTNAQPVPDASGCGNTGTVYGATWMANGFSGGAYSFDGLDDYIRIAKSSSLNITPNMTVSFWMKYTSSFAGMLCPISKNDVGEAVDYWNVTFDVLYQGARPMYWFSGSSCMSFDNVAGADVWQQVTVVQSNTVTWIYTNGTLAASASGMVVLPNVIKDVLLGRWGTTEYIYKGLLDEVLIYARAFTPVEVTALYRAYVPVAGAGTIVAKTIDVRSGITQTNNAVTNVFMGRLAVGTNVADSTMTVNGTLKMGGNVLLNGKWLSNDGGDEGLAVDNSGNVTVSGLLQMNNNVKLNNKWLSGDGDNEGVYVSPTGTVGIGTSVPLAKHHVAGSSIVDGLQTVKGGVRVSSAGGTGFIAGLNSGYTGIYIHAGGGISVGTSTNLTYPTSYLLQVNTPIHVVGTIFGAGDIYQGANCALVFSGSKSSGEYLQALGNDIAVIAGGVSNVVFDGDTGRMGVGTNLPQAKLHVAGDGWFQNGVTYSAPLGDLSMGCYTNR